MQDCSFVDLDAQDGSAEPRSDVFDSLVRNAFCFLQKAIQEFEESPKYSAIHFCAAVELLMKARLMREHWSLIVSRPDQADIKKFKTGDFKSVSLVEARERLQNVAGENIPGEVFSSFQKLAQHRNKVIHFFHEGIEDDEKEKAQIVAEQCRAWFHLHRLLGRWNRYFSDFNTEIAAANDSMKQHRQYLSAKFAALKLELDELAKKGVHLQPCGVCDFEAAIPDEDGDEQIAFVNCRVCDHADTQVTITCPHCDQLEVISGEGFATCSSDSSKSIEPDHLVAALADEGAMFSALKDGDDSWELASCGHCDGYQTVVRRGIGYFCTGCFELFDHIELCEWCNEPSTGDMEDSYGIGCGRCDGQWGHVKDH